MRITEGRWYTIDDNRFMNVIADDVLGTPEKYEGGASVLRNHFTSDVLLGIERHRWQTAALLPPDMPVDLVDAPVAPLVLAKNGATQRWTPAACMSEARRYLLVSCGHGHNKDECMAMRLLAIMSWWRDCDIHTPLLAIYGDWEQRRAATYLSRRRHIQWMEAVQLTWVTCGDPLTIRLARLIQSYPRRKQKAKSPAKAPQYQLVWANSRKGSPASSSLPAHDLARHLQEAIDCWDMMRAADSGVQPKPLPWWWDGYRCTVDWKMRAGTNTPAPPNAVDRRLWASEIAARVLDMAIDAWPTLVPGISNAERRAGTFAACLRALRVMREAAGLYRPPTMSGERRRLRDLLQWLWGTTEKRAKRISPYSKERAMFAHAKLDCGSNGESP